MTGRKKHQQRYDGNAGYFDYSELNISKVLGQDMVTVLAMKKERLVFRGVIGFEVLSLGCCWRLGHEQVGWNVMGHSLYSYPCSLGSHNDKRVLILKRSCIIDNVVV